jgi:hypothetical protein
LEKAAQLIPLTECSSGSNVDQVMDNRSQTSARGSPRRYRAFALLLILTTIALGFHIQLAAFEAPLRFPGKHILHGDLRPDCEKAGKRFAELHGATPSVILVVVAWHFLEFPHLRAFSVVPFSEPSICKFLDFLILFVRPPPPFAEASN